MIEFDFGFDLQFESTSWPERAEVGTAIAAALAGLVLPRIMRSRADEASVAAVVLAVLLWRIELAGVAIPLGVGAVVALANVRHRHAPMALIAAMMFVGSRVPDPAPTSLVMLAGVWAAIGGGAAWVASRSLGRVPTLFLLAGSAAAIFGAVPDTEQNTVLVMTIGLLAAGRLLGGRSPVAGGDFALGALLMWATAVGARGRAAAFVAGPGALVVIMALPVLLRGRRLNWFSPLGAAAAAIHLGSAAAIARSAGIEDHVADAVPTAVLLAVITVVVLAGAVYTLPGADAPTD